MNHLDKMWDDTVGGPIPETNVSQSIAIAKPSLHKLYQRSLSMESSPPASPTASSPATTPRDRENVWRSVFNPGSNRATKKIGSQKFDNVEPNSTTVYDWLYSGETRSKWR